MKTVRSDFALTAPWTGILGKPAVFGITDVGQLTGIGFARGQVPVWSTTAKKFVPGNISNIAGYVAPDSGGDTGGTTIAVAILDWAPDDLKPLQSQCCDFDVPTAFPGLPILYAPPYAMEWTQIAAYSPSSGVVRMTLTNMNLTTATYATGTWQIGIVQLTP